MSQELLIKGALKVIKNLIPPDKMKQVAASLLSQAIDYKNTLPLSADETQIAAMAWDRDGEIFTSIVFLNSDDQIVRYDAVRRADELIENLINKL